MYPNSSPRSPSSTGLFWCLFISNGSCSIALMTLSFVQDDHMAPRPFVCDLEMRIHVWRIIFIFYFLFVPAGVFVLFIILHHHHHHHHRHHHYHGWSGRGWRRGRFGRTNMGVHLAIAIPLIIIVVVVVTTIRIITTITTVFIVDNTKTQQYHSLPQFSAIGPLL